MRPMRKPSKAKVSLSRAVGPRYEENNRTENEDDGWDEEQGLRKDIWETVGAKMEKHKEG